MFVAGGQGFVLPRFVMTYCFSSLSLSLSSSSYQCLKSKHSQYRSLLYDLPEKRVFLWWAFFKISEEWIKRYESRQTDKMRKIFRNIIRQKNCKIKSLGINIRSLREFYEIQYTLSLAQLLLLKLLCLTHDFELIIIVHFRCLNFAWLKRGWSKPDFSISLAMLASRYRNLLNIKHVYNKIGTFSVQKCMCHFLSLIFNTREEDITWLKNSKPNNTLTVIISKKE